MDQDKRSQRRKAQDGNAKTSKGNITHAHTKTTHESGNPHLSSSQVPTRTHKYIATCFGEYKQFLLATSVSHYHERVGNNGGLGADVNRFERIECEYGNNTTRLLNLHFNSRQNDTKSD